MKLYGYDGSSRQRVVGCENGRRKVLGWGDNITEAELSRFRRGYSDVRIEPVESPEAESLMYPQYAGRA